MHPAKVDVAVLMLFFNRPDQFSQVFAEVKKARPSKLFLYQDGPRGDRDMAGIEACRAVCADDNIDWECDVHRNYSEVNRGCDPSEFLSQKWAFSIVDKCIVLEDDDIPSQSFFPFCKEMLDRYEDDPRVWMIAGFNEDERTPDCQDSYFFTSVFSIWGWASWRRVIDTWEGDYAHLKDKQTVRQLHALADAGLVPHDFIRACHEHAESGKEYYETIFWCSMLLNNGLAVMPSQNLITNIGMTDDSTHFSGSLKTMPRGLRRIFTMGRHELEFPLRHPKYMVEHVAYKVRIHRSHAWGHPWIKVGRSLEELWLNLCHGNLGIITKAVRRRINIWMGKEKHS